MSINRNDKTCRLKPRYIEYSDFKSEAYRKQLIVISKDNNEKSKSQKLFYWDIPKPNKELIDKYEQKKLDFTTRLNKNISERLRKYDESGKSLTSEEVKDIIKRKPLTQRQLEVMKVFAGIKEDDKFKRASNILGISISAVHKNKTYAEKKGYVIEEFREDD
jgi:hypothetical protein